MRKRYDFSKSRRNPYAKALKRQVTIRLDAQTIDYFKQLALYLQNAWSQVGIKVKLTEADQSSLTDAFYKGQYDLAFPYAQFTSDLPVPDEYAQFVAHPFHI